MSNQFDDLATELDKESMEWLQEQHPLVFDAIEIAVIRGASAEEIRAFVVRRVGVERSAMANRCEATARYLLAQQVKA